MGLVPICCRGQNSPAPCFGGRVEITPGVFLFVIEVSLPLLPVLMEGSRSPLVSICCRGQNSPAPCFGGRVEITPGILICCRGQPPLLPVLVEGSRSPLVFLFVI